MELYAACCAGSWLHSEAASAFGPGMIPEDLLGQIPAALAAADK
jgi:NAD(P)H-hydrate epimerase